MEKGYMISDAARILEVENHVLRYWEEELELAIPRNEMGHRYYREEEMKLLRSVKDLKEQGFQLKAIKKLLPDLEKFQKMEPKLLYQLREELNRQVLQERNYELEQVIMYPIRWTQQEKGID
jgi:DNA-binding transcriptional MerR regulator